tara:strand:- start:2186 stop:4177 length:1992 start_codon:yes stop_codon:yes gene_type:complete
MSFESRKNEIIDRRYFWVLLVLGSILRAFTLGRSLGGNDENQILLEFAGSPLPYILSNYSHGAGGHHVFHTIVIHGMGLLFGEDNPIFVRLPAFASGMILLWLTYEIALWLFRSEITARYALLTAVVCPVHIFYSQVARGYSFSMTFGLLCAFSAIRYLESRCFWVWGGTLLLSGFMMVYTIPTNVFFIFGLVVWLGMVLGIPEWKKEFKTQPKGFLKAIFPLTIVFVTMGILVIIAYWPLLKGMIDSAENFFLVKTPYPTRVDIVLKLIPDILKKIYPDQVFWFLPILVVSIANPEIQKKSFRFLPIIILFVPFIFALIFKIAWYSRTYIFIGPFLNIFFGAGLYWSYRFFSKVLNNHWKPLLASLPVIFCLVSLNAFYRNFYPRLQSLDLASAAEKMDRMSGENDLLAIASVKNYLHSRTVYKSRLKNIISQGRLNGINFLKNDEFSLGNYTIRRGRSELFIFKHLFPANLPKKSELGGGLEFFPLARGNWVSHLSGDYASNAAWNKISGKGQLKPWADSFVEGESAFFVQADPGKDLVVYTVFPELIRVRKNALVALTWAGRNLSFKSTVNHPEIGAINLKTGRSFQLSLGEVNDGVKVYWKEPRKFLPNYWLLIASLAQLAPGDYNMSLWLKVPQGEKILYDGFRFFTLESDLKYYSSP